MGTMLDLPAALRAAGLTVWVAADWKTNGHTYDLITPFGGVLHHTAGYGLRAVYGEPDARPDVPQPRCNLWTPRPGTQPYDIAVICAGRAWQAGAGHMAAYDRMRAGGFSVKVPDAAVLYGPSSDDIDAGWTSQHTLGNEVENLGDGTPYPERQLDVVAVAMGVCVDVLGWPGVGCWAHHRQLTYRKPDMSYRGDLWSRAAVVDLTEKGPLMALTDAEQQEILTRVRHIDSAGIPALGRIDALLPKVMTVLQAAGVDSAKRDAAVLAVLTAIQAEPGTDVDALAAALAPKLAELGVNLDVDTIVKAIRADLASALAEPAA